MNTTASLSLFHPAKLIGTWFGAGLSPKAPGTVGSLAALPFAYVIQSLGGYEALLIASFVAFIVGWGATIIYLRHTTSLDPKEIVVDEVAAQWLVLAIATQIFEPWHAYAISFAAFRFFDVVKPWPVSLADRKIKGGFGVMFDDMLAAFYCILLALAYESVNAYHRGAFDVP